VTEVVELEIPARAEFVGIARMAVSALAGVRPGLPYERVDDLRIVVSEACTSAIEAAGERAGRVTVRCFDSAEQLEVRIEAAAGAFDSAMAARDTGASPEGGMARSSDEFRISLIRSLVDDIEVRPSPAGTELRLVLRREPSGPEPSDGAEPPDVQTMGQG
jgi:serine/threonine-protein kinase RsbW